MAMKNYLTKEVRGLRYAAAFVVRGICESAHLSQIPRLLRFTLQSPNKVMLEFNDGRKFSLCSEFLRVQSPAVDSKVRSIDGEKVISGRRHVSIMSVEPVGNYGIRLFFDDMHNTGIYTWDYLYKIGSNKLTLMKEYIRTLRKFNLSRSPQRTK